LSNSMRVKERRLKRKHLSKYQRNMMARQHTGDINGRNKPPKAERDKSLAARLGLNKQ